MAEGVGCELKEGTADDVTVGEVLAVGCVLTEAHDVTTSATKAAPTPDLALWTTTNLHLRWRVRRAVGTWLNARTRSSDTPSVRLSKLLTIPGTVDPLVFRGNSTALLW